MSQENVELVTGLYAAPDVDYVQLFGDDGQWTAFAAEVVAPRLHADFRCVLYTFGGEEKYAGLDGLRTFLLDWMVPWVTYRVEVEEAIDLGRRVLLHNHDFGRREESAQEVKGDHTAVWTICDGKIARAEFYPDRAEAVKALGLET